MLMLRSYFRWLNLLYRGFGWWEENLKTSVLLFVNSYVQIYFLTSEVTLLQVSDTLLMLNFSNSPLLLQSSI